MVLPLVLAAASGGAAVGGSLLADRAARKAAKYQQQVKDRWMAQRRALAKALADNYTQEGDVQQRGMTSQLQALASGDAAREAIASSPDARVIPSEAAAGLDPAFRAAFARRGAAEAAGSNTSLAADTASTRRRRFAKALNRQAADASAPARYRSLEFGRGRFLNAMAANQADADMQLQLGDIPNSARNMALAGNILQSLGSTGIKSAGMM